MDTHKNARLTPKGREEMVRAVVDYGLTKAAAARQYNTTAKTVAKWVKRFREEGVGWFARPILKTSFIARPNPAGHMRRRRGFAPTALHRQADRRRTRRLAGDRQSHPAAAAGSTR